jgi:hypothetical protein
MMVGSPHGARAHTASQSTHSGTCLSCAISFRTSGCLSASRRRSSCGGKPEAVSRRHDARVRLGPRLAHRHEVLLRRQQRDHSVHQRISNLAQRQHVLGSAVQRGPPERVAAARDRLACDERAQAPHGRGFALSPRTDSGRALGCCWLSACDRGTTGKRTSGAHVRRARV